MNELQWKASHPDYSIWVSASAGTGKTKILTDRVLRLLLKGASPQKILCLTFTNAAASEMQHRIDSKLSKWAKLDGADLRLDIESMLDKKPTAETLRTARELFNSSLKINGKIEIHTIHSYCQKILKCFPLEANVSPGFQIIDEIKSREILKKIKNQLYLDSDHSKVMDFFTANFHEVTINDILDEVIKQKLKFKGHQLVENSNFENLNAVELEKAFEEIKVLCLKLKEMFKVLDDADEAHKINTLNVNDKSQIFSLFLTKGGKKKQRVIPAKIVKKNPEIVDLCDRCQEKIYQFDQLEKTFQMVKYTGLLKQLAEVFIDHYEAYKIGHGLLDYDDLIFYAKNLLNHSEVRDWVLYKLDGGIDHLLVDEAQDTSPYQWEIIEALIAEFYAGAGARKNDRTIFVVGDEKQSIFSFQGADLQSLNLISVKLKNRLKAANKNYENISLKYSYRSVPSIIEAVYHIFERIKQSSLELFQAENPKILAFREAQRGRVELWPLVDTDKPYELFWPKGDDHNNVLPAQKQLAINIANYIKNEIDKGEILPSTGLPVRLQDFMILVRKRDILAREIINQLKLAHLQTAGIDRMLLSENMSVMDLIAIAKFVLSPSEDLNLAILLKSPIIGFNDELLDEIVADTSSDTIWEKLQHYDVSNQTFSTAIDRLNLFLKFYNICDCSNFFHIIIDSLGYREVLANANGAGSNDAINELLYLSHNYASNIDSSLQSFIFWFETNEIEIKRNVQSTDKIKIMTVHGSKGLQAPIVILCDTTKLPISKAKFYHTDNDELIACQQSARAPQIFNDHKQAKYQKDLQEYLRLLYVGMTRPQDHLIICGYKPEDALSPYCWYSLVESSLKEIANTSDNNIMKFESIIDNEKAQLKPSVNSQLQFDFTSAVDVHDGNIDDDISHLIEAPINLAARFMENNEFFARTMLPEPLVMSPLLHADYLEYGKIFHKILEDTLQTKDILSLRSHPLIGSLSLPQQNKIYKSIDGLIKNAVFKDLINSEIRTEINVGVYNDGETKLGRIDLLSIKKDQVTIIDYKSDARPPAEACAVPLDYINQLKFYSTAIRELYPDRKVISQILWLQNGKFMEILN